VLEHGYVIRLVTETLDQRTVRGTKNAVAVALEAEEHDDFRGSGLEGGVIELVSTTVGVEDGSVLADEDEVVGAEMVECGERADGISDGLVEVVVYYYASWRGEGFQAASR
jgi:hypothetical protein